MSQENERTEVLQIAQLITTCQKEEEYAKLKLEAAEKEFWEAKDNLAKAEEATALAIKKMAEIMDPQKASTASTREDTDKDSGDKACAGCVQKPIALPPLLESTLLTLEERMEIYELCAEFIREHRIKADEHNFVFRQIREAAENRKKKGTGITEGIDSAKRSILMRIETTSKLMVKAVPSFAGIYRH